MVVAAKKLRSASRFKRTRETNSKWARRRVLGELVQSGIAAAGLYLNRRTMAVHCT
jgi:hypothetical protein